MSAESQPVGPAGIDWVTIPGGTFIMGLNDNPHLSRLPHKVTLPSFQLARTPVTVAQYKLAVDAGACAEPLPTLEQINARIGGAIEHCNWRRAGREDHPVNCVDWFQAKAFCEWAGGRLPSEAEWEYAARSAGKPWRFPWGDEPATCDLAVIDHGGRGCGKDATWPVGSKPKGNTLQGLCDMAGNVWEWTQDCFHDPSTYEGAPIDGSARECPPGRHPWTMHPIRGGSWCHSADEAACWVRGNYDPTLRCVFLGFRPARSCPIGGEE